MDSLAKRLRQAARVALPDGAFLRRDRGDTLFVSDAPGRFDKEGLLPALARAGFEGKIDGALVRMWPGSGWLYRLEAAFCEPPDAFCASLVRFAGREADGESLALFSLGARLLDGEADDGRFDRALRQRAAECLRLNRTTDGPLHGGGLYACALLRYLIKEA